MKAWWKNTVSFARPSGPSVLFNPNGVVTGLCNIFLCLALGGGAFAQATKEASASAASGSEFSNLEIVKLEWKREVRLPRNFDPAVIPTGGTFNDPVTRTSSNTAASVGSDAIRSASARSAADSSSGTFPATPSRLPVFYVYSMSIKNVGPKAIEGIAWDYVFVDRNLNGEVSRHQFLSYAKIPPTKTVTLRADLRTPPISVIGAPTSGSSQRSHYTENAVVQCVLYEDESVWKNPHAKSGVCEFLKASRKAVKRNHGAQQRQ